MVQRAMVQRGRFRFAQQERMGQPRLRQRPAGDRYPVSAPSARMGEGHGRRGSPLAGLHGGDHPPGHRSEQLLRRHQRLPHGEGDRIPHPGLEAAGQAFGASTARGFGRIPGQDAAVLGQEEGAGRPRRIKTEVQRGGVRSATEPDDGHARRARAYVDAKNIRHNSPQGVT